MFRLKFVLPAAIAAAGLLVSTTVSYAKPEYTKATKKGCAVCHTDAKAKPKELTDAGKYYKEKKTLDGYQQ